jgi:hypothetical protein
MGKVVAFLSLFLASVLGSAYPCLAGDSSAPLKSATPQPGTTEKPIVVRNFGFQCGLTTTNCGEHDGTLVWPRVEAQPGMLRLHDVGTSWSDLSTGRGTYDWTRLDAWLDMIAEHQPIGVIQVFSWVPCWEASPCEAPQVAPTGTHAPPDDLTASGSPSFNNFVTRFVQHCSRSGNCTGDCPPSQTCAKTNLIKYYEMWNEWDTSMRWTGTVDQLYDMLAPATDIIRENVTDAVILTPSTTRGKPRFFEAWLNTETSNGRISDWVVWHDYLWDNSPEDEWNLHGAPYLSTLHSLPLWKNAPWADTETNYNVDNFACAPKFTASECTGQIVRWQLIHSSNGSSNLNWYKWNETIASNAEYETTYYYMMQYLMGGKFGGPCASAGSMWTCNFTKSNGGTALWVWTAAGTEKSFTVPSAYIDYLDLKGVKTTVQAGQSINIGPIPIMLEK